MAFPKDIKEILEAGANVTVKGHFTKDLKEFAEIANRKQVMLTIAGADGVFTKDALEVAAIGGKYVHFDFSSL